jgi:hypothetical protein
VNGRALVCIGLISRRLFCFADHGLRLVVGASSEGGANFSLRRAHLIVGVLGVISFVITGQVMARHVPEVHTLPAEVRMMYVSRHIYLLGAALVNLVLGLYLQMKPPRWRGILQQFGSLLILLSALALLAAFVTEPPLGIAGRSWRSFSGLIALFAGVMTHLVASVTRER